MLRGALTQGQQEMTIDRQAMILACYEEIRESSLVMLRAEHNSDVEGLVAGEQRCAASIDRLQSCGDDVGRLDKQSRKRAHGIILAILAHDAEIRELVQPGLRQLETYMGSSRRARRVAAAYRP